MGETDVVHLGSSPDAVPRARKFLARRLSTSDVPRTVIEDAELAVAELVTNALLHATPPVSLRVVPDDVTVRVEVIDGSRTAPVRGRASTESMTGRGLALVEALALRWGVEAEGPGKVVWAELGPGRPPENADLLPDAEDIDVLLAAWSDDEPVVERFSVHVGDVPTDLLLAAKAHVDSVVREFALAASGARSGFSSAVPQQLATLIETVVTRFADARLSIKRQALAAAQRGDERTDLTLTLPTASAADAEAYLAALDEADSYARAARLLTLETPPEHRTFRRWYVSSLVTQLRAAEAGRRTGPPETFEHRLMVELRGEALARANLERIAGLQTVTAALGGATSIEDVARVVVEEGVRALNALGGGLLLPGDDGHLRVPLTVGYGDRLLHQLRTEPQDAELPAAETLRTGRPVWLESPQERDERYPALHGMEPGTAALCAVPLVVGHRRLGALRFSFAEPRLFDAYERRFVLGLADQTAQAVDRALIYEAERRAREQAESLAARLVRLQTVAAELGRAMTVAEVADVVVTHAAEAVGAGLATVSLFADDETLEVVRSRGVSQATALRWERYRVDANLPGSLAVRTGEPVLVADVAELEKRFPELTGQAVEDSSLICLPMRVGRRTIGVMSLNFAPHRNLGSRTELAFFGSLADSCAQAVERSRAVSSLETAVTRLSFLADATSELTHSRDAGSTLATLAELVVPRLADWCAVDLLDESGGIRRVAVAHVDPAKIAYARELQARYPVDLSATTGVPQVLRTGESELYPQVTDEMLVAAARDEEHLRVSRELGLRSAMLVPLRRADAIVGVLTLASTDPKRHYDADDLAFAEDIARRASVALERAN